MISKSFQQSSDEAEAKDLHQPNSQYGGPQTQEEEEQEQKSLPSPSYGLCTTLQKEHNSPETTSSIQIANLAAGVKLDKISELH